MFSLKGMIINEVKHFSTDRQTKSEIAEKIEKATKYINDHWEQTLSAERGDGYLALEDLIKKVINILEDRQVPPEEFYDLPIAKIFFKDEKFNQSFEALILFESFDLSLSAEDAEIQIADRIESEKSKVMDISNGSNNNRGALITFLESYLPSKPKQENEIPFTTNEHKGIGLAVTLKFPVDNQTDDSPVTRTEFASSSQAFILCRFRDGKGVDFGTEKLSYAQIVALAGDYFGVPEKPISESSQESERQIRFKEHFNQLAKNENLASLVSWIFWIAKWIPDRLNAQTIAYTKLLGKSYSQLLATNFDHFAPFSWDAYQAGHQLALELAIDARNQYDKNKSGGRALLAAAYLVDGYASHFLSDSFSSGHLRVPRASMAKIGGLILGGMSVNDMHEADGEDGLIVCTPGNEQWFARGDGHLEGVNRNCVIAALQQSVEDIFEAFKERKKPLDRVSALVPSKVLAAGETGRNPDSDRSLKQTFPRFKFGDGASVVTQKDPSPYPQNPRTAYTDTFDKKKAEDLAGLGRRAGASVIYSDFDTADLSRVPQMDLEKEQRCLTANKIREDGPVHRF